MANFFEQFDDRPGGTAAPAKKRSGNFFEQFDEQEPPPKKTIGGWAGAIGRGVAEGAVGTVGASIEGAGLITEKLGDREAGRRIANTGRGISEYAHSIGPSEEYRGVTTDVAGGVGSMGVFTGLGATTGVLTRGASALTRGAAGIAAASTMAGPSGAAEAYQRAIGAGLSEEEAVDISLRGILPGVVQVAPVAVILRRIPEAHRGKALAQLRHIGETFTAEFIAEGAGAVLQNMVQQSYDPGHGTWDEAPYRAAIGGSSAALIQLGILGVTRGKGFAPGAPGGQMERQRALDGEAQAAAEQAKAEGGDTLDALLAEQAVYEQGEAAASAFRPDQFDPIATTNIRGEYAPGMQSPASIDPATGQPVEGRGNWLSDARRRFETGQAIEQAEQEIEQALGQRDQQRQQRAMDQSWRGIPGQTPIEGFGGSDLVPGADQTPGSFGRTGQPQQTDVLSADLDGTGRLLVGDGTQDELYSRRLAEALEREEQGMARARDAMGAEPSQTPVTPPAVEAPPSAPPAAPASQGQATGSSTWRGSPEVSATQSDQPKAVLQNRNRATPAMIGQMTDIAANPDYTRLGFSRDFANGAPVVEPGAEIPAQNMGRVDVATTANGRKIPIQYAVVEADQLLPSNRADGTPIAEYEQGMPGTSRAIAGNGRVAGLQRAHEQGNADGYTDGLLADAALHGIPEDVVRGMQKPVLVRVMPQEEVTNDIGDESNTSGTAELSPAEQARNDTRRIDINAVQLDDNGEPTAAAVEQFIASMPTAERSGLMDGKRPNRRAYERLGNAVFAEAYESDALLRLAAEATDAEARTIMSGLKVAAGKMSRLKGLGDYDTRQLVIEAAETALNARRQGQSLTQFIEQGDMGRNPFVMPILDMMAKNIRSAKAIGENLSNLADVFYNEASRADTDMFGDVQKRPPQQLMDEIYGSTQANTEGQKTAIDPGRPGPDPRGNDGQAVTPVAAGAVQPEGRGQEATAAERLTAAQTRRNQAEADKDVNAMIDAGGEASAALIEGIQAEMDAGRMPVIQDGSLYHAIHPSTSRPGKLQITTYSDTGALSDTTVDDMDGVQRELNASKARVMPTDEANETMNRIGLAEAEYQQRRQAFDLAQETEQQRTTREQTQRETQAKESAAATQAEQRAQADADVGEFSLTGSDRQSDANPNQGDLLGADTTRGQDAAPATEPSNVRTLRDAQEKKAAERAAAKLNDITISETMMDDSGNEVTVEQSAAVALRQIDKRLKVLDDLLGCVKGST